MRHSQRCHVLTTFSSCVGIVTFLRWYYSSTPYESEIGENAVYEDCWQCEHSGLPFLPELPACGGRGCSRPSPRSSPLPPRPRSVAHPGTRTLASPRTAILGHLPPLAHPLVGPRLCPGTCGAQVAALHARALHLDELVQPLPPGAEQLLRQVLLHQRGHRPPSPRPAELLSGGYRPRAPHSRRAALDTRGGARRRLRPGREGGIAGSGPRRGPAPLGQPPAPPGPAAVKAPAAGAERGRAADLPAPRVPAHPLPGGTCRGQTVGAGPAALRVPGPVLGPGRGPRGAWARSRGRGGAEMPSGRPPGPPPCRRRGDWARKHAK